MTGPVWDGKGIDPWLPHRLDARIEAASTERQIRAAVWSELSHWLTALERRMIRDGAPPDLNAVWALEPSWREAVGRLLRGQILKAIGTVFRKIVGPGVEPDSRPAVNRYLTEVRNRLVRIPEEVYDLVAGEVAAGINAGDGIPELAARVDGVLSRTASERWPNRATVIARTETISTLNFARLESFGIVAEDDPDTAYEVMWLSTDNSRTRPAHVEADQQRVPIGQPFVVGGFPLAFPGDPTGPAHLTIQCRCTALLVEAGEVVDLSNRQMRQ